MCLQEERPRLSASCAERQNDVLRVVFILEIKNTNLEGMKEITNMNLGVVKKNYTKTFQVRSILSVENHSLLGDVRFESNGGCTCNKMCQLRA